MRFLAISLLFCIIFSTYARTLGSCDRSKGDNFDDACDAADYARQLAQVFIPGIIIAIIVLISCPVFFAGRLCCNCLGGRDATEGCCCPNKHTEKKYTRKTVLTTKGFTIAVFVLVAIGLIVGFVGSGKVNKGVNGLFDAAQEALDKVVRKPLNEVKASLEVINKQLDDAANAYGVIGGDPNSYKSLKFSIGSMSEIDKSLNDADDSIEDAQDAADNYDSKRSLATIIILIVCVIFVGVGSVLGVAFNTRRIIPYIILLFIFILAVLMWILFAFHVLLAAVTTDICKEVDLSVESPNESTLKMIVYQDGCPIKLDEVEKTAQQIIQGMVTMTCTITDEYLCPAEEGFDCTQRPPTCNTMEDVDKIPTTVKVSQQAADAANQNPPTYPFCPYKPTNLDCTVKKCAEECKGETQATSQLVVATINIGHEMHHILYDIILPLLDCDSLFINVVEPFQDPCHDLRDGLSTASAGVCILACGLVFAIIVFILGIKRFIAMIEAADAKPTKVAPPPQEIQPKVVEYTDDEAEMQPSAPSVQHEGHHEGDKQV